MSQTNPAHSASASALHITKPPQGEHLVVQNTGNIRIECAFSAKEATLRQEGEDLIFTFSDGTSLTIAHYYATNAESSALPPLIMAGEAVQVPQLLSQEAAQQEAEQEAQTAREPGPQESPAAAEAAEAAQNTANTASKGKALPQNSGDAPSDSPTQQGQNAQNSSSTQASPSVLSSTSSQSATATALDGGRFHNFDTNELLDGIHRLPGLDLPWGQKLHESKLDYSGLVEEDEIEADAGLLVEPAEPADPVDPGESAPSVPEVVQTPPTLVVDAARLTAEEAGVRLQNSDPNADFAGTALITGKVQGTDAESTDLEYGFLHNGSLVQTLTTSYGSVTMAPDGSYSYSLNNDLPEINTMKEGQQAEDSFTVAVSDGQGGMDSQVITVEIHGTNDMPTLQLTDISFTAYGKQTVFSGQAVGGDGDTDASWTYGLAEGKENPLNAQEQFVVDDYGTLYIDTVTGVYRYELDHTNTNPLAKGESHECTVTVIVTDELGAHTDQDLTVHLTGSGDYVDFKISGTATEAGVKDGGNLPEVGTSCTGQVDLKDTNFELGSVKFSFKTADGNTDTIDGIYGTFTIDAATGAYSYTLNNAADTTNNLPLASDTLPENEVTIVITDSHGVSMEVPFTVTVTGTNDRPIIESYDNILSLTEHAETIGNATQSGFVRQVSDVDSSSFTYGITHMKSIDEGTSLTDFSTGTEIRGLYGSLNMEANGKYTYTLDNSYANAAVGALKSGEQLTDTFYIAVKDANGAFDIQPVTITINGTNSAPQFSTTDNYILKVEEAGVVFGNNTDKAGTVSDSNTVNVNGVDQGAQLSYSMANQTGRDSEGNSYITTEYGTITIDKTSGKYTYTLKNDSSALNALQSGKNFNENFIIVVTNTDTGKSDSRDITVTINTTNDRPVITETGQKDDIVQSGVKKVTGTMVGVDPEDKAAHLEYGLVETLAQTNAAVQTMQGKYGYLQLDHSTGSWTYVLNKDISFLGATEYATDEKFYVRVTDKDNAFSDNEITIKIMGKDDNVSLQAVTSAITEDTTRSVTSSIVAKDVDSHDIQHYEIDGKIGVEQENGLFLYEGAHGYLLFNKSTGEYTYTLKDNDGDAIQELNVDTQLTDSFTVTVTSTSSSDTTATSTAESTITVTITGTNDAPVLELAGDGKLAITGETLSDKCVETGTLHADDIDDAQGNLLFYFSNDHGGIHYIDQNADGTYGSISITPDGKYTYTLDLLNLRVIQDYYMQWVTNHPEGDWPADYPPISEKFQVMVKDAHGGVDSETLEVSIPYNKIPFPPEDGGKNDQDIDNIEVGPLTVTEDDPATGPVTAIGHVTVTFIDPNDTMASKEFQYSFKDAKGNLVQSITDEYGTLTLNPVTGEYVYTLNNASDLVQALAANSAMLQKFSVCVVDKWNVEQTGKDGNLVNTDITVTINGANDAPEILSATNVSIAKDAEHASKSGKAEAKDIDTGDTLTYSYSFGTNTGITTGDLSTKYGTFTILADGSYTYKLTDAGKSALATLGQGDIQTESITLTVTDASGEKDTQTITVTITGTNDVPTLSFTQPDNTGDLAIGEDQVDSNNAAVVSVQGTVKGTDSNTGEQDSLSYSLSDISGAITSGIVSGKYGTMTIDDSTGIYSYMLNNAIGAVQSLGAGQTLTETFYAKVTDHHGGYDVKAFTVTITGKNDAPTLSISHDDSALHIDENATDLVLHGKAVGKDIDIYTDPSTNSDQDTLVYGFKNANGTVSHTLQGIYGKFEINQSTGEYTYTLDKNLAAPLQGNEVGKDSVQVIVTDTSKDTSNEVTVNVSIQGKNTVPEISIAPDLSVTEDGTLSATGNITASDVDGPKEDMKYWILDAGGNRVKSLDTEHHTISIDNDGKYTYTLVDTSLAAGETGKDSFKVVVTDEFGASEATDVTVTITGAADAITPPAPTPPAPTPTSFSSPVEAESLDALLPASVLGPEQGAAGSALAAEQGPGLDRELPAALEHASLADMQACLDAMPEVGLCSQGGGQGDAPEAYTPFIADDLPVDMPLSLSDKGEAQLAQEVAQRILAETGAI